MSNTANSVLNLQTTLLRVASADDEKLESVSGRLLPNLLPMLGRDEEEIKDVVKQILDHVVSRFQAMPAALLPFSELLRIYNETSNVLVADYALKLLALSLESTAVKPEHLLSARKLLQNLAQRNEKQQTTALHLFLKTLSLELAPVYGENRAESVKLFKFLTAEDRAILAEFLQDVMYLTVADFGVQPKVSAGLSLISHKRATNAYKLKSGSSGSLSVIKTRIVAFLKESHVLSVGEMMPVLIVAGKDSHEQISKDAAQMLTRLVDTEHELENMALVKKLISMFLGSVGNKNVPKVAQRKPCNPDVRVALLENWLCKSKKAANSFPFTLQVLFEALYGKNSFPRLRRAGLQLFHHIVAKTSDSQLSLPIAKILQQGAHKLIKDEPKSTDPLALHKVRGNAYAILGRLSTRKNASQLFVRNLETVQLMFNRLESESEEARHSVQDGLASLRETFRASADISVKRDLKVFLLLQLRSTAETTRARVTALTWLNELYAFDDAEIRYECIVNSRDTNTSVRSAAEHGFLVRPVVTRGVVGGTSAQNTEAKSEESVAGASSPKSAPSVDTNEEGQPLQPYPKFEDFIAYAAPKILKHASMGDSNRISPLIFDHMLTFARSCLDHHYPEKVFTDEQFQSVVGALDAFEKLIHAALDEYKPAQEHAATLRVTASHSLVRLLRVSEARLKQRYGSKARVAWLTKCLSESSFDAQVHLAEALGLVAKAFTPAEIGAFLREFLPILAENPAPQASAQDNLSVGPKNGAVLAVGELVRSLIQVSQQAANTSTSALSGAHLAFAECLSGEHYALISQCARRLVAYLASTFEEIRGSCCVSLGKIGSCVALPLQDKDDVKPMDISESEAEAKVPPATEDALKSIVEIARASKKHRTAAERAVQSLGEIALGCHTVATLELLVDGLTSLSHAREEELHFAIGKSLSQVGNRGSELLDSPNATAAGAPAAEASTEEKEPVVKKQRVGALTAPAPGSLPIMSRILDEIVLEFIPNGSAVVRSSACVWLLALVRFSAKNEVVQARLPDVQHAFSSLLADSRKFTQECASKGLAHTFEASSPQMREDLVSNLVSALRGGKDDKKNPMVPTQAVRGDTQIHHKSGMSTYRELASVAQEFGQPDMIYKLLDIATSNAIWASTAGSAFTLQSLPKLQEKVRPHLKSMIPKLYRYQYDSNQLVRQTMGLLWKALVTNPIQAVNDNFVAILDEMLDCFEKREWRVRDAAVTAVGELLSGRSFDEIGSHLEILWKKLFQVLDDVIEDVVQAATRLARKMSNLTKRLCDPKHTDGDNVKESVQLVLPLLLDKGIVHRAEKIRGCSIHMLVSIASVAGTHLRPHLPKLITALLEGMSTLEPAMLSYMQFHASSYNVSTEQFESMRVEAAKASPLADALTSCLTLVNAESMEEVVRAVSAVVQHGVGLATKSAAAQFIIRLLSTEVGRKEVRPFAKKLTQAFAGGLQDGSPTIRKDYAAALAHVCTVAPSEVVLGVLQRLSDRYLDDKFATETSRLTAASTFKAITYRASDAVKEHVAFAAPLAFLGIHDPDADTRKEWKIVWGELAAGKHSGIRAHRKAMIDSICELLKMSSYALRLIAIDSIIDVASILKRELQENCDFERIVGLMVEALYGRTWEGKFRLLEAFGALAEHCREGLSPETASDYMALPLLAESTKTDARDQKYRRAAIATFGKIATQFPDELDMLGSAYEMLASIIDKMHDVDDTDDLSDLKLDTHSKEDTKENADDEEEDTKMDTGDADGATVDTGGTSALVESADGSSRPSSSSSDGSSRPGSASSDGKSKKKKRGGLTEMEILGKRKSKNEMLAVAFTCLGDVWPSAKYAESQHQYCEWAFASFDTALEATDWMVRVAVLRAMKRIFTSLSFTPTAERPLGALPSAQLYETAVKSVLLTTEDGKYSAIRLSAMEALLALLKRSDPKAVELMKTYAPTLISKRVRAIIDNDENPHVQRLAYQCRDILREAGVF